VDTSKDSGTFIDYCLIEDVSTLLWVANLAALELHVPLAFAKSPDTPTAMFATVDAANQLTSVAVFVLAPALSGGSIVSVPINADSSQLFLFQQRAKWSPGGPPAAGAPH